MAKGKFGKRRGMKRGFQPRRWKRKSVGGALTTLVNNSRLNPIPQRFLCKMKYADTFQIPALGSVYRFNLNSIFDPNRTGTGHQPYGRDTFATLYNRYRVYKVTYAISVFNSSTSAKVAVCPANIEMGASTVSEIMENPMSKWIIQLPGGGQKVLKGSVYLPALVGRTKEQYMADDRYQADVSASPIELAILNIFGQSIGDGSVAIDACINLTYHVEFFDRNSLSQS